MTVECMLSDWCVDRELEGHSRAMKEAEAALAAVRERHNKTHTHLGSLRCAPSLCFCMRDASQHCMLSCLVGSKTGLATVEDNTIGCLTWLDLSLPLQGWQ